MLIEPIKATSTQEIHLCDCCTAYSVGFNPHSTITVYERQGLAHLVHEHNHSIALVPSAEATSIAFIIRK
ncbi:hypothetical protein ACN38_g8477 [Penicillium nordicum]|uniref:Uncharacterized protein n=1 Tax=Penicillium nordicum TaxID=229535 RepID=A0A0M8NW96_9EURO|nr:hypothetical protein ACN38_g8477 [Penicillium nordicum]